MALRKWEERKEVWVREVRKCGGSTVMTSRDHWEWPCFVTGTHPYAHTHINLLQYIDIIQAVRYMLHSHGSHST